MYPVLHERGVHVADRVLAGDPDPQFPVLNGAQCFIEAAGVQKYLALDHQGGGANEVAADQLLQDLTLMLFREITVFPAIVYAPHEYRIRMGPGITAAGLQLALYLVRGPQVIRVQERDPLAFGFLHTPVTRHSGTCVGLLYNMDAVWILFKYLNRKVFRAVIHCDDFDVRVGLGKYTCQRLLQL